MKVISDPCAVQSNISEIFTAAGEVEYSAVTDDVCVVALCLLQHRDIRTYRWRPYVNKVSVVVIRAHRLPDSSLRAA